MNILPKKSWHVLSKDNIQRVRRDEAEAKAIEEEKLCRASLAEKESQLTFMRKRARERDGIGEDLVTKRQAIKSDGHINFFSDVQQGVGLQLSNKDRDKEEKADQEAYEKKIGLLNYLVDKSKSDDPWYISDKKVGESTKSEHRKQIMDPMNDMKQYLGVKKKNAESCSLVPPKASPSSQSIHEHKDRKQKFKKSKREDKKINLEKLRKERCRREEAEAIKSDVLLREHYGIAQKNESSSTDIDDHVPHSRKYNSQFNPHLARK